ncbi:MAG: transpeptidase family protein [Polyangiaceae bacterium]|nr:transpeptidase family protein [Polyangiaceae bacterium]
MKNVPPARAKWIKIRMALLCGFMGVGLGFVVSGADRIQNRDGAQWLDMAERQRQRRLHIEPKRGTIYDRNGIPLAESVEVPSISLDAVEMLRGIQEAYVPMVIDQNAERIAAALHLDVAEVREKITRRRRFAWLKRRVSEEEARAVQDLSDKTQRHPIRGLALEGEGRRFYPNKELAGSLIGFVAPDGNGKEGLELSLNEELKGKPAEVHGLRDRSGRLIFSEGLDTEQALAGHNVYLTIDRAIQFTAERELAAAVRTYEAQGGSIVVMDPMTGEILAMASGPGFDPNDYGSAEPDARRNRALVDRYEPGSTMKMFTLATAFSHRTISPTEPIYCEDGNMPIDNIVIHDTHVHKWLTPTQILQFSSNIGSAKIGLGLGQQRLYEGFRRFGFGESPGLPVPGQSLGVLRPRQQPWVQVETASASFGQGISVTTIQLAAAVSSIANRGRLLEPIVIKRVSDSTGVILDEPKARVRRAAVSPAIAKLVGEMLVSVTEGEGTGVEASVPGFKVAGKTATAQKIDPETGKYNETHYVASFIGFVPADKPRLAIAVAIDEPMAGTYAGGSVAAPVFRRVAEMALGYLGVTPDAKQDKGKTAANAQVAQAAAAARGADPADETYKIVAGGRESDTVLASEPVKKQRAPKQGELEVPDLSGYPARAAILKATSVGLFPQVEGSGRVLRQEPAPGSVVTKGTALKIVLEPPT